MATSETERTLLTTCPKLNSNRPIFFVACWVLILIGVGILVWKCTQTNSASKALDVAVELLKGTIQPPVTAEDVGLYTGGLGIFVLFIAWLQSRNTKLTVTTLRTIFRSGLLSKHTSEIWHRDVRNVQIDQSFGDRLMGVGRIAISSAGQSGIEIDVSGVSHPEKIQKLIDQHRG